MRFVPTLIVSSLVGVLLLPIAAGHSPPRTLARLQHHQPRLIDLCVSIPSLAVDLLSLLGANVELCLCLRDLDLYLQTTDNVTLQNGALANVNAMIGGAGPNSRCDPLPANSRRACTNTHPCHYECLPGFTDTAGQCLCPAPNAISNGKCGPSNASGSAPSAVPRSHRRSKSRRGLDLNVLGLQIGSPASALVLSPSLAPSVLGAMTAANAITATNLPATGPITSSTVAPVLDAVHGVVGSTASTLPSNVDSAVQATQNLQGAMTQCGCGNTLGNLLQSVEALLNHLLDLQKGCSGGTAPTVPGPASCLTVDASKVVCGILPGVYVGPVVLCGLLGPQLTGTVQKLVTGLGLGPMPPATSCIPGPPPAALPAAVLDPSLASSVLGAMTAANAITAANLPATGPITSSIVAPVLDAVHGVVGSTAATLPSNVDSAVQATQNLQGAMTQCGYSDTLENLVQSVEALLNHLLDLQKGCSGGTAPTVPGPASCLTVDASKVVCGILPGVYVGPVVLCGLLGPQLTGTIQKLVTGLGLGPMPPATSCIPGPPPAALPAAVLDPRLASSVLGAMTAANAITAANLPATGPITSSTVAPVLDAVHGVVGSTAATLPSNVDSAVQATQNLQGAMTQCGCSDTLGNLVQSVEALLNHLLDLQKGCSGGTAPTVPGPASCLTVDASKVVCGILPGVYVGPVVLCGLLGPELTGTIQKLVTGLGLGPMPPATSCLTGPPAATLPPVTVPPTTTTPPPTPVAVSDPDTVINLAGLCIHLAVTINLAAGAAGPSCGGLIPTVNGLVNSILGKPLVGSGGLLSGVINISKRLNLGDVLNLGGGPLALGGVTNSLAPTINNVLSSVNAAGATCDVGLEPLLENLLSAVDKLVAGLHDCGCDGNPAVASAIAATQVAAMASIPPVPATFKRAFRSRSRRGHVNFVRSADAIPILAPSLVGPMTSTIVLTAVITSMQSTFPSTAPSCSPMLSALRALFGTSSTTLSVQLGLAITAAQAYQTSLTGCGCVDHLKLGKLVEYTEQLLRYLLDMQSYCGANPSTVLSTAACRSDASVVCGLLPSLSIDPSILCALGPELSEDTQNLIDAAGLDAVTQQCSSASLDTISLDF
ncbi:hypothetical protein DFH09DRAFT_1394761 [Mycena vulgaris]|nr:hypothetical protein DFH09DRAFT_1394761 [Mycena vulgaris]